MVVSLLPSSLLTVTHSTTHLNSYSLFPPPLAFETPWTGFPPIPTKRSMVFNPELIKPSSTFNPQLPVPSVEVVCPYKLMLGLSLHIPTVLNPRSKATSFPAPSGLLKYSGHMMLPSPNNLHKGRPKHQHKVNTNTCQKHHNKKIEMQEWTT